MEVGIFRLTQFVLKNPLSHWLRFRYGH